MAVPTVPTINSILTEALKRAGNTNPSTAELTRAEDEWFEEIKRDVMGRKAWQAIQETIVLIPLAYVTVYAVPSPLYRVTEMWFYSGEKIGTAQAGTSTSITIASGTGSDDDFGRKIYLTGATGAGQNNRISGRSADQYTVACAWTTTPDATSTYMIADTEYLMSGPDHQIRRTGLNPSNLMNRWEQWEDQLHVTPPVDNEAKYALEIRGTVDVSLIDETDARFTRLLREWRTALSYGVMIRQFEDNDDDNALKYELKYERAVNRIMVADSTKARRHVGQAVRGPGGLPR